jgi:hypothetical protein
MQTAGACLLDKRKRPDAGDTPEFGKRQHSGFTGRNNLMHTARCLAAAKPGNGHLPQRAERLHIVRSLVGSLRSFQKVASMELALILLVGAMAVVTTIRHSLPTSDCSFTGVSSTNTVYSIENKTPGSLMLAYLQPHFRSEIARLLLVLDKIPKHERDRVRRDLLDYCHRDALAMLRLVENLEGLPRVAP